MKLDVLIIGHGLAGSVLSHFLQQENQKFLVLDEPENNESSRVAAGLYNPVTGRKMVKTWQADTLFPLLKTVYRQMELALQTQFLYLTPVYRPFLDVAEQNEWQGRSADAGWQPYIQHIHSQPLTSQFIRNPYGGIMVGNSGWVDVPRLLAGWSRWLGRQGCYRAERFEEDQLEITDSGVRYGNIEARAVVYANGRASSRSRYWHWLPFRPVKGEILYVETSEQVNFIPNRGVFMAPVSDAEAAARPPGKFLYRVGSTYHHQELSTEPTSQARQELEEKLQDLLLVPYQVVRQVAGIRPATKDRRPLVGRHPQHKTLYILNGLGTKGVSLAPYCAQALAAQLVFSSQIPEEINIDRYFSLY